MYKKWELFAIEPRLKNRFRASRAPLNGGVCSFALAAF
jgi:hypothetical protein